MLKLSEEQSKALEKLTEALEDSICNLNDHEQTINESLMDSVVLHVKDGVDSPRVQKMQYTQRRMHSIFNALKDFKKAE